MEQSHLAVLHGRAVLSLSNLSKKPDIEQVGQEIAEAVESAGGDANELTFAVISNLEELIEVMYS